MNLGKDRCSGMISQIYGSGINLSRCALICEQIHIGMDARAIDPRFDWPSGSGLELDLFAHQSESGGRSRQWNNSTNIWFGDKSVQMCFDLRTDPHPD